jgi:hypothetical protein
MPLESAEKAVDSTSWTGTRLVLTDEKKIIEINEMARELRDRVYSMHIPNNADSQDLKGLCDALVAVCEMAQPELSIIQQIVNHPKFQMSAALVAAIATLRGALGI